VHLGLYDDHAWQVGWQEAMGVRHGARKEGRKGSLYIPLPRRCKVTSDVSAGASEEDR